MVKYLRRLGFNTNTDKTYLSRAKLVDFLFLSGQLLKNGFPSQAIVLTSLDLQILTDRQGEYVENKLQNGASLAMSLQPIVRQTSLLAQLEIAEQHGDLASCCLDNAQLLEEQQRQLKQLRSLLIYPLLLFTVLGVMALFLQFYLKPQLVALLPAEAQKQSINWWLVCLVVLSLFTLIIWLVLGRLSLLQKRLLFLRLPILGKLYRSYQHYLIFTDLGHLLASGLSLQEILQFAGRFNHQSFQGQLADIVQQQLKTGQSLTALIQTQTLLPNELKMLLAQSRPRHYQSIELQVLGKKSYQKLQRQLRTLIDQVQPILFVIIAVLVGTMYFQLLAPLYQIMKGF